MAAIRQVCGERGARCVEIGRDVRFEVRSREGRRQAFDVVGASRPYPGLEIDLMGMQQVVNATVAVAALDLLSEGGADIPEDAVKRGLRETDWPARMQILGDRPTILADGAHTLESTRGLARALEEEFHYRRLILVFGIASDKDISGVWRVLERKADVAFLTRSTFPKAAEPRTIAQMIDDTPVEIHVVERAEEAFERARAEAGPEDLICVTGSFYLIGDVMRHLGIRPQKEE